MGFGAIIGSYLAGILSDTLKLNYVGKIAIIGFSLGAFISIISLHYKITYLAFLTAFVWGFSILFLFNWLNVVCSRIFNGSI
jgi:predicted MFS family arabinose efflux permease